MKNVLATMAVAFATIPAFAMPDIAGNYNCTMANLDEEVRLIIEKVEDRNEFLIQLNGESLDPIECVNQTIDEVFEDMAVKGEIKCAKSSLQLNATFTTAGESLTVNTKISKVKDKKNRLNFNMFVKGSGETIDVKLKCTKQNS